MKVGMTTEKVSRKGATAQRDSVAPLRRCASFFSFAADECLLPGRVIHSPKFVHAAVVESALDDLISEQRKHATAHE